MLDNEDLKWLASHATELNGLLQQMGRYSDQVRQHDGEARFLDLLNDRVELASRKSQELFDRLTSRILAGVHNAAPFDEIAVKHGAAAGGSARTNVTVKMPVGEVGATSDEPKIQTPANERELILLVNDNEEVLENDGRIVSSENDPLTLSIQNPMGRRELILLVDDDEEVLENTGGILVFEDYRVVLAKDGPEALRIYRRMGPAIALIILDYFLPIMDGDAVFDELKAMDPDVRVVLSSGFGEQAKLGSMLARGLCGFLPKPYTYSRLIEHIRSILDA